MIVDLDDPCNQAESILGPIESGSIPPAPMSQKSFIAKVDELRACGELRDALSVPEETFSAYLSQAVPCIGCRR